MKIRNELLPHQHEAVKKLRRYKVGALFMEQGTGKTITAIDLCRIKIDKNKIDKIIWLCPCSAKDNIKEEIIKQAPREMLPYIIICGIETLSTSVRANAYLYNMAIIKSCALVIDESLLIKNPKAKRTQNILRLAKKADYRLILNGSPISKDERDLYSQFYALDWRILGYQTYWAFEANHIEYDEAIPNKVVQMLNVDYLIKRIEPYTFKISKDDCLNLPAKMYDTKFFYLTPQQEMHYFDIAEKLFLEIDEYKPETIYQFLSALQAILSGREVVLKSRKGRTFYKTKPFFINPGENPRLKKLDDYLDNTAKTIIYCNYTEEIENILTLINEKYGQGTAVRFDGKISNKERQKNRKLFKENATFLIANPRCAGYSLNLQFCHRIIYFSNNWDLAPRIQSEDRVHRYGQKDNVEIIDICAIDTLDERIKQCLERKEDLLEYIKKQIGGADKMKLQEFLKVKRYDEIVNKRPSIYDCSDLEVEDAQDI